LHWRTANTVNFFPTAGRYHLVLPLKLDFFLLPLPCAKTRRTANTYVCRAFSEGARQSIFKKVDFCPSFYFSTTTTFFVLYSIILYMSR
jgi:hypothetical protein